MPDSIAKLSEKDRLGVMELFAKYAWAIDSGDPEGVLQCFAEGARVKAFFSILQHNVKYRTNSVFGIGT